MPRQKQPITSIRKKVPLDCYTIHEHSHRFATWAAATGASASPKCRFRVADGKAILEAAGFDARLCRPSQLPKPSQIERVHAEWCRRVMAEARKRKLKFTHGIAAKLINLYLKARFTCGGYADHPNVAALHPSIDSLLLKALNRTLPSAQRLPTNWSTFDAETYQRSVGILRLVAAKQPLWQTEELWQGYRYPPEAGIRSCAIESFCSVFMRGRSICRPCCSQDK